MSRRTIYSFIALIIALFSVWMFSESDAKDENFSERVKVSLRDVGHQLLHSNQDSTSLILPVIELDKLKYKLSFQNQLKFEPSTLVSIVDKSFKKSELSKQYRVEVIQCSDKEVAYSYKMSDEEENTIIPCRGRFLPENCYTIEVRFINRTTSFFSNKTFLYALIFSIFLVLQFYFYKKKRVVLSEKDNGKYIVIGSFHFYSEQNKLVKEAVEISLSKKECELLEIFVANPNQIIKRDELMKKVWEDNGVFVGRSLDTYISKLRKKLKEDTSIKLTNIHGVGYKLEINH